MRPKLHAVVKAEPLAAKHTTLQRVPAHHMVEAFVGPEPNLTNR
jgi:hypothetical protein